MSLKTTRECFMPDLAFLRERFYLDELGVLRYARTYGRVCVMGEPAGRLDTRDDQGYWFVEVRHNGKKKKLRLHRVVWCLWNNKRIADDLDVDHEDRNRSHNHPLNLVAKTKRANNLNRSCAGKGYRLLPNGNYKAEISVFGKMISLGTFAKESDAAKAAKAAMKGRHPKVTKEMLAAGTTPRTARVQTKQGDMNGFAA